MGASKGSSPAGQSAALQRMAGSRYGQYVHTAADSSRGQYVRGGPDTGRIETVGNLGPAYQAPTPAPTATPVTTPPPPPPVASPAPKPAPKPNPYGFTSVATPSGAPAGQYYISYGGNHFQEASNPFTIGGTSRYGEPIRQFYSGPQNSRQ